MKTVCAHQSVFLPYLGLLHKIALSDVFVFMDTTQYLQRDFNNRNYIKSTNGEKQFITVPVKLPDGQQTKACDVLIDNTQSWNKKIFSSLQMNYARAPYWHEYEEELKQIFLEMKWDKLIDLNKHLMKFILREYDLSPEWINMSDLKIEKFKSDLILEICKKTQANCYISGSLAKNYMNVEDFVNSNIFVYFQEYAHPIYEQINGPFLPYMNVLDVLFNVRKSNAKNVLMKNNISREAVEQSFNVNKYSTNNL